MVEDVDWEAMADLLELEGETNLSYVTATVSELAEVKPRRVLDVGGGPGVAACEIAAAFPAAEVVVVDGAPGLLARAVARGERLGTPVSTLVAEFPEGLTGLGAADLVWSARTVHHLPDQAAAVRDLVGLLNPGGALAITEGGLAARWLPRDIGIGRPGLETRLGSAFAERFERMRSELPGSVSVVEDWAAILRDAGLVDVRRRGHLIDLPAPLGDRDRLAARRAFERYSHLVEEGGVDAGDAETLRRLLDPDDPAGIDRRPDVSLLAVKTVYLGRRPA